jgi:hypothetical protein
MKLGGWQRVWVLIAALWLPLGGWQFAVDSGPASTPSITRVLSGLAMWAGPLLMLYGIELAVAWVRRGFAPSMQAGAE